MTVRVCPHDNLFLQYGFSEFRIRTCNVDLWVVGLSLTPAPPSVLPTAVPQLNCGRFATDLRYYCREMVEKMANGRLERISE